jgi:formylglycine-generating enzyme required for sulfatase activity
VERVKRGRAIGVGVATLVVAGIAITLVIRLAAGQRQDPARCPAGLAALGARCCAPGQRLDSGACVGTPDSCPTQMRVTPEGCVAHTSRVLIPAGRVRIGPSDWEAEGMVEPREATVARFEIDATEVTHARWKGCVRTQACRRIEAKEPGLPVTGVTPDDAQRFCRLEGGRLPSGDEWILAASGNELRRFAWGATGLVCRRATFGLVTGPCGHGASGPELAAARPDGATPRGVLDLAGNVAEWAREPNGEHHARGGSFRSRVAGDLKSWAAEPAPANGSAAHVGFRCAYDVPAPAL